MGQASLPVKVFPKQLTYDRHAKGRGAGGKASILYLSLENDYHPIISYKVTSVYRKIITICEGVLYYKDCPSLSKQTNQQ